jgi:competence CoiA-like predicted nuclease
MYLQNDSSKKDFPLCGIEVEKEELSFFEKSFVYITFENKKEMDAFYKKLLDSKVAETEAKIELNEKLVATETVDSSHFSYSTTEKADIINYEIKNGIIVFYTTKGDVKIYINKKIMQKIKEGLNDINWSINT